jgi:hypothetical protein
VTATDAGSELDPWSWQVSVNGKTVQAVGNDTGIATGLGTLAPGTHMILVSVTDTHGNRSEFVRTYESVGSPGAEDLGGVTGIFAPKLPTTPRSYGSRVTFSATALDHGSPLAGNRVIITVGGREVASDTADANGLAVLSFVALRAGEIKVFVSDPAITPATGRLLVSPRVRISVSDSTPAVGAAVRVSGRIIPAGARARVALQARIGNSWFPLRRSLAVDSTGRFHTKVTSSVRGRVAVRVFIPAHDGWSRGYSNVRVLSVG